MATTAAFPSTNMEAAFGRLHNSGAGAFDARPTVVDSFMDGCALAGGAADVAETPSPTKNQQVRWERGLFAVSGKR